MQTIAAAIWKSGTGKTSTVINLAAELETPKLLSDQSVLA